MASPSSSPQRLRAAARELLRTEGHTVSVDAIVAAAGLSKPTFYVHFASRDELVKSTLEEAVGAFFEALEENIAAAEPAEKPLAPFHVLLSELPDPDYRGCLCINAAATYPIPGHATHGILADHDDRLARRLEELLEERDVDRDQAATVARQIVILFDGAKARGLVDTSTRSAIDAREAARSLIERAQARQPRHD